MELMIPMPELEQPAVLLASGPGPAPAAADRITASGRAMLRQLDRSTGLRGWMLTVCLDTKSSLWPQHHFSRMAAGRPPLIEAREKALAAFGFEVADREAGWLWREYPTSDGKQVELCAFIDVRPIAAPAGEAAAL